jgi:hypothetical protein
MACQSGFCRDYHLCCNNQLTILLDRHSNASPESRNKHCFHLTRLFWHSSGYRTDRPSAAPATSRQRYLACAPAGQARAETSAESRQFFNISCTFIVNQAHPCCCRAYFTSLIPAGILQHRYENFCRVMGPVVELEAVCIYNEISCSNDFILFGRQLSSGRDYACRRVYKGRSNEEGSSRLVVAYGARSPLDPWFFSSAT